MGLFQAGAMREDCHSLPMSQESSAKELLIFDVLCHKEVSAFVSVMTEIRFLITVIKSEILMADFSPSLKVLTVALVIPWLFVSVSPLGVGVCPTSLCIVRGVQDDSTGFLDPLKELIKYWILGMGVEEQGI